MPQYSALIRGLSAEKFTEILGASARQAREVYFHRHNIRKPKASSKALPKAGAKNEFRTAALFDALRQSDDDELAEEILRSYLLTKRQLLAAALDHLGIPHQDGLTDSDDVKKMEGMAGPELKKLVGKLKDVAEPADIALYLKFMGADGVDEALG